MGPTLLVLSLLLGSSALLLMILQPRAAVASPADPSISISLFSSASPTTPTSAITVGGSVFADATLTGVSYAPGSSVTYSIFDSSGCSAPLMMISTVANGLVVTVGSGPKVPNSPSEPFNSAGDYSWNAYYSATSGGAPLYTSPCAPLIVEKMETALSLLLLPSGTIQIGASVAGFSQLTNAFAPTGTVQYEYFKGDTCYGTAPPIPVGLPVTVTSSSVLPSSYFPFLAAGSYSWNAAYSGDGNNTATTSPCELLTVQPAEVKATAGLVAAEGESLPITVGGSLSFSVSLSGETYNAGGSVAYSIYTGSGCITLKTSPTKANGLNQTVGTGQNEPNVPNSASATFGSAGSYSVKATYSGDANNTAATSVCLPFAVSKATPTLTLSLSSTSIKSSKVNSLSVWANLTEGFSATGGGISFSYYHCPTGSASCTGVPSCSTGNFAGSEVPGPSGVTGPSAQTGWIPAVPPGNYSWQAVYSGDGNNTHATSQCVSLTVYSGSVSITTTFSGCIPSTATFCAINLNEIVTVTATLSGTTGTPSGTIKFEYFSGGYCLGPATSWASVPVVSGSVDTPSFTSAGLYSWRSVYSGVTGTSNNKATSPCVQLVVGIITETKLYLSCPQVKDDSVVVGSAARCTATVRGSRTSAPAGTVSWSANGPGTFTPLPNAQGVVSCGLSGYAYKNGTHYSICTVKFAPTAAGSVVLSATYGGSSTALESPPATYTLKVTQKQSTVSIGCSASTVPKTGTIKCTATVTGYSSTPSKGDFDGEPVTWTESGSGVVSFVPSSTCTLLKGSCSVTLKAVSAGSTNGMIVTAVYEGDINNLRSQGTKTLTVG